ncbi:MAG TPA: multicopper oxidase domain-containing protein [Methylomirabilota bacterium]|nr:multicopper oxidase domain-containing protein [Methylomirabilota bacterium]
MDILSPDSQSAVHDDPSSGLSRRGFLRAGALAGGGIAAVALAACTPAAAAPKWTYGPSAAPGASAPAASPGASLAPAASAAPDHGASHAPASSASPAIDHDANAAAVIKRFLDGEAATLPLANEPLKPRIDGDTMVFELTIDEIDHRIDALKDPVKALGYNGVWPGPLLSVVEGDRVRAIFKNNLHETTGVHFHGQRVPNAMDGVPHITQEPIQPGASFTYEFVARTSGSHMYHSHHNATDQVGRGLLGAFIVQPRDPALRYDRLNGASQDIVWISNDTLGGFTINGRGFPATAPIVARLGETIVIRFMNEGTMMHPWHLHGMPMRVVARDGYPLGAAAFTCDTLGVNPGERWDVVVNCDEPGAWAFHCHILPHAEGPDGMYGMVTALIVQDKAAAVSLASAGAPAYECVIPTTG